MKKRFFSIVVSFFLSFPAFAAFPTSAVVGMALVAGAMVGLGVMAVVGAASAPAVGLGVGLMVGGSALMAAMGLSFTPAPANINDVVASVAAAPLKVNVGGDNGGFSTVVVAATCIGGEVGSELSTRPCWSTAEVPATVAVDPTDKTFKPNGAGSVYGGVGADGEWTPREFTEGWDFVGTDPLVSASISDDGKKLIQTFPGNDGSPAVMTMDYKDDGHIIVSVPAVVNVVSPEGNPESVAAAVAIEYNSVGFQVGVPAVVVTPTSSGALLDGSYSLGVSSGGTGASLDTQSTFVYGGGYAASIEGFAPVASAVPGTGVGSGLDTGSGNCAGGDCATESTQIANKGILQSILDFFTGSAVAPDNPVSRTATEIKAGSLDGTGAFTGLQGWQLPAHASQCPTSSFAWNGNTYTFDAHCQLATDYFAAFRGVMTLVFSLSALFVVLKA